MMDSAYNKKFWTLNKSIWPDFQKKVFNTKGAGFTIELTAEDDSNFLTRGRLIYAGHQAYHSARAYAMSSDGVKESLRDIGIRNLPTGIRIEKNSTTDNGRKIRKVHMVVSRECSSYIFNTYYAKVGIPFCNLLLTKYQNVLQDIRTAAADKWYRINFEQNSTYRNGPVLCFSVANEGLKCLGDKGMEGFYGFDYHEMKPLQSDGQRYGMALALIAVWKRNYPELNNMDSEICDFANTIYVQFIEKAQPTPPPVKPKKLKEWI